MYKILSRNGLFTNGLLQKYADWKRSPTCYKRIRNVSSEYFENWNYYFELKFYSLPLHIEGGFNVVEYVGPE